MSKIPPDAFTYYFGLGPDRSYQTVADKYGVSKRSVTKLAVRENWQDRVTGLERKARESSDQKILETLEDMNGRHLKTLRVIQGKALETLKTMPLASAMEAVRALDMSIAKERIIRGEPSDRTAVSVEETIKREYERWMMTDGDQEEDHGDSEAEESEQAQQARLVQ